MHRTQSQNGFSSVILLVLVLLLGAVGGTGWYVYRHSQTTNKTSPTQNPAGQSQPITSAPTQSSPPTPVSPSTPQPVTTATPSTDFDIEAFYNKIQNGMSPEEVTGLANKQPDGCSITDSYPESRNCYWYSGNKTVTVSYGNKNAVQTKSKTGF